MIDRRDFLSGVAITGAAIGLSPAEAIARGLLIDDSTPVYPPALTGMRGSHAGSFEVAHSIAWQGKTYPVPTQTTDEPYDLVIVGGGISGLSAAHYARRYLGEDASILILDNHDDFGGHAKRNEFTQDGRIWLGSGGSQSIDSPSTFSAEAVSLMKDLHIETDRFYDYFDRDFSTRYELGTGLYLNETDQFLRAQSTSNPLSFDDRAERKAVADLIDALPIGAADREAMISIFIDQVDWLSDYTHEEKLDLLRSKPYRDLLKIHGSLSDNALSFFTDDSKTLFGTGWDVWSGLEAVRLYHPGTIGLGIDPATVDGAYSDEPYIFHFPDGNASLARLLVKRLIPDIAGDVDIAGDLDMEKVVLARFDYSKLDQPRAPTQIRLNSTAVRAENIGGAAQVCYVRDGKVEKVIGRRAVMACYNHMLPFIMPEMPEAQATALQIHEKAPLTYVNVVVRNWRFWKKAGIRMFLAPGCILSKAQIDYPVSMGGYECTTGPDSPAVIHMIHAATAPGEAIDEQARQGRHQMYAMSLRDYEHETRKVLSGAFDRYGFDFDRDVSQFTVNRWPHGYAYEYNELYDDPSCVAYHGIARGPDKGPHVEGRQKIGNISIANSDSSAFAYLQGAINAAHRAVQELYG